MYLLRVALLIGSLVWMGGVYAQQGSLEGLRTEFNQHLTVSAQKIEKLDGLERRVAIIEDAARSDKVDARMARVEAGIDSLKAMIFGLGLPILVLMLETMFRLVSSRSKRREV